MRGYLNDEPGMDEEMEDEIMTPKEIEISRSTDDNEEANTNA
ncbi:MULTISPECIES: hypothetical protein [Staphylococcus]|nr:MULTISPECIES: hypothetical protein [Staphylococcus]MDG4943801.1 hypothetical protein [Staphylococcus agnetis]